ncbi:MAG: hypothetical protein MZV49_25235 [Rhodopseudomonas palustris]|nr:hypothetical protein [Rhodopseudomonas palustris]
MTALARETAPDRLRRWVLPLPFDRPGSARAGGCGATGPPRTRSSMLQDVLRGAPTEIDAICGAVVRAAEKHKLGAPGQLDVLAVGEGALARQGMRRIHPNRHMVRYWADSVKVTF